ncbi:MAG: biotin transporter BioY [bacterium]
MKSRVLSIDTLIQACIPGLALSILGTILIALSARISFLTPLSPVPVTLQVAAVLLAGMVLGSKWGTWTVIQYILVGLMGAPIFAMGLGGPGVIVSPSFGYLAAFVPAAWIAGRLSETGRKYFLRNLLIAASGVAVIYSGGFLWLSGSLILSGLTIGSAFLGAWTTGIIPFVIVDMLKILLVAGLTSVAASPMTNPANTKY